MTIVYCIMGAALLGLWTMAAITTWWRRKPEPAVFVAAPKRWADEERQPMVVYSREEEWRRYAAWSPWEPTDWGKVELPQRATNLANAHQRSFKNRVAIAAGERCGCFHCCAEFASGEIAEWADDGMTALCPRCGIDAVIPLAPGIDAAFLERMQARWWKS